MFDCVSAAIVFVIERCACVNYDLFEPLQVSWRVCVSSLSYRWIDVVAATVADIVVGCW